VDDAFYAIPHSRNAQSAHPENIKVQNKIISEANTWHTQTNWDYCGYEDEQGIQN
jgi:hypothetical protein